MSAPASTAAESFCNCSSGVDMSTSVEERAATGRREHARPHRRSLAAIARERDDPQPVVEPVEALEGGGRSVGRAVVDDDQLLQAQPGCGRHRVARLGNALEERADPPLLVERRRDDRQRPLAQAAIVPAAQGRVEPATVRSSGGVV